MKNAVTGFWLFMMLIGFGCTNSGNVTTSASNTRQDVTVGTSLPHINTDENAIDGRDSEPSETPEEENFFYFSYDDSASTAARDLTKFYIDLGLSPSPDWGRAYEYLNAEKFSHFSNQPMGPFDVSVGLYHTQTPYFPKLTQLAPNLELYSFGVNISGPSLSKNERPNLVATLLVDVSGSMNTPYAPETRNDIRSLLDVAKYGLGKMLGSLKTGDVVNIVTFSTEAQVELEDWHYDEDDLATIDSAVSSFNYGSTTNLNEGIDLAYRVAQRTYDAEKSNRVILLTDAYANTGEVSPTIIANSTVINGLEGIYFAGVGIGNTFDDRFLNELTDIGKGNYAAMITPEDAERIFVSQFASFIDAAARDVRFKLDYPPALEHLIFTSAAEEISIDPSLVQTTNFAYNTQQYFLEHFASSEPLAETDFFRLTVTFLGSNNELEEHALSFTINDILGLGTDSILSASMVTNLAHLVADEIECSELISSEIYNLSIEDPIYIKYRNMAENYCAMH